MQKRNRKRETFELAVEDIHGNPETAHEMVNKYGTYEIQPTNDTKNPFPTIAQGLSEFTEKPTKADDGVPRVSDDANG
ncbi:MAG: hypothetical protein ACI4LB_01730 [Candidatus Fimenecus sp.]